MIPRTTLGSVSAKRDGGAWRVEWVVFNASGTVLASSHGATVSRTSTGVFPVTWSQPFGSVNYMVQVTSDRNRNGCIDDTTLLAASVTINIQNDTSSATDPNAWVAVLAMGR